MDCVALLRGINVGGNRRVEMKRLKALFESLGCTAVSTYINSGNVLFKTGLKPAEMRSRIEAALEKEFGFAVPTIVRTRQEMRRIADAIPEAWRNDAAQRTDVAYLFKEADSKSILDELPLEKAYVEVRYVKGAVCWNIDRKDYRKSRLDRLIGHKLYRAMTIRNVNTARILAGGKRQA